MPSSYNLSVESAVRQKQHGLEAAFHDQALSLLDGTLSINALMPLPYTSFMKHSDLGDCEEIYLLMHSLDMTIDELPIRAATTKLCAELTVMQCRGT